jgi:hypothetical protein
MVVRLTESNPEENNEEQEETCSNTRHKKTYCECFDCRPGGFSLTDFFMDCRNIDEFTRRSWKLHRFLEFLETGGFEVEVKGEGDWVRIHDPIVGGCYWVECRGCGYPLLLDIGDDPDKFICGACHEIVKTKADQPKYYSDLFEYIDMMFEFASKGGRSLTESYGFSKEFCNVHGFDFEAVKRRLEATGGYNDGEVMMNSVENIPLFDELPVKLEEPEQEENTIGSL